MIFVLGILLAASVIAADTYVSDEGFKTSAECDAVGYEKIFSLKGANGEDYSYCVKKEAFDSSKSFLIDSYLAFGVEICDSGRGYDQEAVLPFSVYKNLEDYNRKRGSTSAKLCMKKQSRTAETISKIDYQLFGLSACASENNLIESFVDGAGKPIYHCASILNGCAAWGAASVLTEHPDCKYLISGSETIGTIRIRTAVSSGEGADCPEASCTCTADKKKGAGTGWDCSSKSKGCGAWGNFQNYNDSPNCKYAIDDGDFGAVKDSRFFEGANSSGCPAPPSCACTGDSSKGAGSGWDCINGCGALIGSSVLTEYPNCKYLVAGGKALGAKEDAVFKEGTGCPDVSCKCIADSSKSSGGKWDCSVDSSASCKTWENAQILENYHGCNYTISSVKEIGSVKNAVLKAGSGCPAATCKCTADSSKGAGTGWDCSRIPVKLDCKKVTLSVGKLLGARESPNDICKGLYGEEYGCSSEELPACERGFGLKSWLNRGRCKKPSCDAKYSGVKMKINCCNSTVTARINVY